MRLLLCLFALVYDCCVDIVNQTEGSLNCATATASAVDELDICGADGYTNCFSWLQLVNSREPISFHMPARAVLMRSSEPEARAAIANNPNDSLSNYSNHANWLPQNPRPPPRDASHELRRCKVANFANELPKNTPSLAASLEAS